MVVETTETKKGDKEMSDKLTKDEFKDELLKQIDKMYKAYEDAEGKPINRADELLDRRNDLPTFVPTPQVVTDEEKNLVIEEMKGSSEAQQMLFTFGKVAMTLLMKAL
jgi:hypothetical protein